METQHQAPRIELGRRVRYHLPYGDTPAGLITEIQGTLKGVQPARGVMRVIHADDAVMVVHTFDGRSFTFREHDVGRLGIGCVDLLDRVHGPALIAQAKKLHIERQAREALERAQAPHKLAAAQAALVMPDQVPLFYWNGLKDDKGGKLQKAWYSSGQLTNAPAETISIYARDYNHFSALVRACFQVENDTDTMTDYFDSDRIRVTPSHPLYAQVRAAFEAQEAYRDRRAAKREAR